MNESASRSIGALIGLAIGDALGAPVEFKPRGSFDEINGYISGGQFNLPAGAWTDDTAMAICLGQSLLSNNGFSSKDLLKRFCGWIEKGENTSTGVAIGIGQNTLRTLGEFKRSGKLNAEKFGSKNDGNGALMRIAPIPIFYQNDIDLAIINAREQSYTTHASDISAECCAFCTFIMVLLIQGVPWKKALSSTSEVNWEKEISSLVNYEWREKSYQDINASGYVLASLEASLWCVENSRTFSEAVLLAVNLGDDADTVGAITGQLAGALYGYSNISKKYLDKLIKRQIIFSLSQNLCSL
ncbi:MAG: ADP-ribosylglycohydrolase family protein [Emcibacteraceae bacterium]|nr:ADP-ribosylglycohydrolase family protein [Emcibacteraceae bacterium]